MRSPNLPLLEHRPRLVVQSAVTSRPYKSLGSSEYGWLLNLEATSIAAFYIRFECFECDLDCEDDLPPDGDRTTWRTSTTRRCAYQAGGAGLAIEALANSLTRYRASSSNYCCYN
jgi:hypothetical protein